MGDRSAEMLNIMIATIVVIGLLTLGFAIYSITRRAVAVNQNVIRPDSEIYQDVMETLKTEDFSNTGLSSEQIVANLIAKEKAKDSEAAKNVEVPLADLLNTIKKYQLSLCLFILGSGGLILSIRRRDYFRKDELKILSKGNDLVETFNFMSDSFPENLEEMDKYFVIKDSGRGNLRDWLKHETIDDFVFIGCQLGNNYKVSGTVEDAGNYYKIGNVFISKKYKHYHVGSQVDEVLYETPEQVTAVKELDRIFIK